MDTLSPNNGSKSSSSGSSAASSSMDLGKQQQKEKLHRHPRNGPKKLSRSRSLLQLLSRHLGRHFHHQNHHNDTVYSSQDDIRSSSTDSFSLSYERGSHECPINGSSLDLEHTSRTSSASACSRYSPGLDYYDQQGHIYVEAVYRPGSAMEQLHPQLHFEEDTSEEGSSNEAEDEVELGNDENENSKPRSASAASAKSPGLHLSRISISSSVSRMLQHFSSPTGNVSMRSLSCSSTPLRQPKKSLSPNNSNSSSSSSHSGSSSKSSGAPASKKDKKQQSILRPPVQYVYMKGMSGLYSRVPSYAVCYPYTLQHMY
ncbi:uncharacterized protein LOC108114081 [Drosophila eugracilis]|uniref:uncharacterized protein LOC108114081 n=1 Tax=Drosophila eugracilis TaxID=29029 RepID=UPI0007E648AD|nr:uncharacterized protein LOC108114081 [Drosophila eugracilis]